MFVSGKPKARLNLSLSFRCADFPAYYIKLPRRKATALLAYPAVTGERQPRDALAAFLWPESDKTRAYAYLRNTLWEINRTLGEGWLLVDRVNVEVNPDANIYTLTCKISVPC